MVSSVNAGLINDKVRVEKQKYESIDTPSADHDLYSYFPQKFPPSARNILGVVAVTLVNRVSGLVGNIQSRFNPSSVLASCMCMYKHATRTISAESPDNHPFYGAHLPAVLAYQRYICDSVSRKQPLIRAPLANHSVGICFKILGSCCSYV